MSRNHCASSEHNGFSGGDDSDDMDQRSPTEIPSSLPLAPAP